MAFLRPYIVFILLPLFISTAAAQVASEQQENYQDPVVLHDSLLHGDLREVHLADLKGWKFTSKDDPSFSQRSIDEEGWYRVPGKLSDDNALPDSLWTGFGWFRMRIKIDPGFPRSVVLENYVAADGAFELYINDSLVFKKGNPRMLPEDEVLQANKATHQGFYDFQPGETYQLAVKHSFHHYELAKLFVFLLPPTDLGIHMFDREQLGLQIRRDNYASMLFSFILSILFMVMTLHFFLHLKTKEQFSNLWVFLITGFIFCSVLLMVLEARLEFDYYPGKLGLVFLTSVSMALTLGFLPLVLHKVLDVSPEKKWKYFTMLPLLVAILIPFLINFTPFAQIVNQVIGIILVLMVFYGGITAINKARKKRTKDLYLIAGSFLGFPLLLLLGIILFEILEIPDFLPGIMFFASFLLIIPVGMSLYQGKKFLRMHTQLDSMVEERTNELEQAMENLNRSHENLKIAQNQIIQQEKLASLGQLTAGIAHEIKNPLNFVTNFSDVCLELIEEAKAEIAGQKIYAVKVQQADHGENSFLDDLKEILETIELNLQKINQHGNRADAIVKSMLLHSRGGSGKKEPTDLNKLVKEYVHLAFHGMRASRNPINTKIDLDLDEDIVPVPLIAEDFSRVLLNLCNNAFDAMKEKAEEPGYEPILKVCTTKAENSIIISIQDNGPGIDQKIRDSILQPFFTTKKGTDGTGLGLSLSNEIVKAHGGEIKVESGPGEGANFIIIIPLNGESKY